MATSENRWVYLGEVDDPNRPDVMGVTFGSCASEEEGYRILDKIKATKKEVYDMGSAGNAALTLMVMQQTAMEHDPIEVIRMPLEDNNG